MIKKDNSPIFKLAITSKIFPSVALRLGNSVYTPKLCLAKLQLQIIYPFFQLSIALRLISLG